ncbi:MAG TPA: glycosyltransferase family 2 protein [Phycisphaerae bacterium]|nr:glycosyltransferase family 2 protein [Phycisphaerae bacterium]HUT59457.1 glycosyltransferase family 2 protein [Phycisphaerae bacterium]
MPLVSVVMSVLNEQPYVAAAVRSILAQTYDNFELIVIDDYSTDRSIKICMGFADPRIRIHCKTTEPKGPAASRNIGIGMARGQYVILQDSDDTCAPARIEKQLELALENPRRRVVGCSIRRVENGREIVQIMPATHEQITRGFRRLYNRATIVSGTILAPTWILRRVPYRVRFRYMQDWDHMLRLYESGQVEFCNCPQPLYNHFIRPKGSHLKQGWLDNNIFVRNCQARRRRGLEEFRTIEGFFEHLRRHPVERIRWLGLRELLRGYRRCYRTAVNFFGARAGARAGVGR